MLAPQFLRTCMADRRIPLAIHLDLDLSLAGRSGARKADVAESGSGGGSGGQARHQQQREGRSWRGP